ncbi:helix-turn-helix domain-containing protein [Duganella sp. CY15W]|uniref:helix-turn-helix domain-containing protein n=1 Tax=Duganella sp. CY15W TaxID=2692172 RepID=UPI0035A3468C
MQNAADLEHWLRQSGATLPLRACVGPLPSSGAALVRWRSEEPDHTIRTLSAHPGSYRLALIMEPLETRIWQDNTPIWGGTVAAGRFRLCPPGESGKWSRLGACDIVNLFLPVALMDQMLLRADAAPDVALTASSFMRDGVVLELVGKMLDARMLAGPRADLMCDHLVFVLACYLAEHYAKPVQTAAEGLSGPRLRCVLRHIDRHLHAPPSNAELAALCGMSQAHFSREFHRAAGVSPHRYILDCRLEHACSALRDGDGRIVDIALDHGFVSASHFSRAFTARYGVSPVAYRNSQRCP